MHSNSGHFSRFTSGFREIISRSDVELARQSESDTVEQLGH